MGPTAELLQKAARATPAAEEDGSTGWLLRHSDTQAWWAGAVLPHPGTDRLAGRVETAERFYAERRATPRFQICPDCPGVLDELLAARGYLRHSPVSLLTAPAGADLDSLAAVRAPLGMTVRVDRRVGPDWLAVLAANGPGTDPEHETRLLRRLDLPQAYVTALLDGTPVGAGRAVADGGWTGVFSMATAPQARRRGVARLVLAAIARWAGVHGAPLLYLQVQESNEAALRLYEAAGFARLTGYHYRVRPQRPGS